MAIQSQQTLNTLQIHYLQGAELPLTAILGAITLGTLRLLTRIDGPAIAVNLMSVLLSSLSVPLFYLAVGQIFGKNPSEIVDFILDHYRLAYAGNHLIEEWHLGALTQTVINNPLYRVERITGSGH